MFLSLARAAFRIKNQVKKSSFNFVRLCALVLLTGALIFCSGFVGRLPKGSTVNGVNVGGLLPREAVAVLRERAAEELKDKRLLICADGRVFEYAYPEINFCDDFEKVIGGIKKSGKYSADVKYYLCGENSVSNFVCAAVEKTVKEPYCVFNAEGEPFDYYGGENGLKCDRKKLLCDIRTALNGNFDCVYPSVSVVCPHGSVEELKANTVKISSFTTYFDGSNADRAANIRLAAQKLNGSIIAPNEVFSFNASVGERTEEKGFKRAKIIQNGKYVYGYGGGVCQVSTTLYNAAALCGLEICEYHPHTLQVSYVPPSRDAMVSGNYCDLKFKNTRLTPVYMRVNCTFNAVTCTLYGQPDGYEYTFESKVVRSLPKPEAEVIVGESGVISYGREGLVSEGVLVKTRQGERVVALTRRDRYLPIADVVGDKEGE